MNQILKCKLLLLTGYLGSGKTTLLQYILKTQISYQVAVIQNEFADEMGIEAPQMMDNNGDVFDSFFELPNGCICCSAKGQLMTAIQYFIEKKPNIQYIIIESNGLADPSNLIKELWVDQGLGLPIELNAIIGLIPSHRFEQLISLDIFKKQLIFADLLVLNFKDLCEEQEFEKISAFIKIINPSAKIKISEKACIDLESIFAIDRQNNKISNFEEDHTHCERSEQISKIFLKFNQQNLTVEHWNKLIGQILWEEDMQIIRIKGLLYCKNQEVLYSLQGVEDIFEIIETQIASKNTQNKILIIGNNIDQMKILNFFS